MVLITMLCSLSMVIFVVKTCRYSVNEGRCWFKYEFTEHEFHVAGLVTEPGAKTMRFSMWGFTFPSREWQVITVNFGKVLGRNCKFVASVSLCYGRFLFFTDRKVCWYTVIIIIIIIITTKSSINSLLLLLLIIYRIFTDRSG